ncbi:MAG: hypothetical protein L6Q66_03660 [Bacteroidia bacterium]|nr:hypothetical protein [Bacteroidia bacterium]
MIYRITEQILSIFSTRELSVLFWLVVIFSALLLSKNIRSSFGRVLTSLFDKKIVSIFLIQVAYTIGVIFLLCYLNLWNKTLIKDTFFWFFGVAVVLFFSINKAKNVTLFYEMMKESFKWTIFVEFLVNFYTFSFWVEFFLVPIITLMVLMQIVSETKKEYDRVNTLLKKMLSYSGVLLILFVGYKSVVSYQDLVNLKTLFSFLLPIILTLMMIPFLYFLALFMNYEELFVKLYYYSNDEKFKWELKKKILFEAKFNLNKVHYIFKSINKFDVVHSDNLKKLIKSFALKKEL